MRHLIFLVEDDHQQVKGIRAALETKLDNVTVEVLANECDFYLRMDSIAVSGPYPHVVICDVMLPWTFADPNAPTPPPEVADGGFRQAGLRCWQRFRNRDDLRSILWIHFTVLDENTVELTSYSDKRTKFVQKFGPVVDLLKSIEIPFKSQDGRSEAPTV